MRIDGNTGYARFADHKPCSTVEDAMSACDKLDAFKLNDTHTFVEVNFFSDSLKFIGLSD